MIELTEAERELCQPELMPQRVAMLAERYDQSPESIIYILREYDIAVAEAPFDQDHYVAVSERLEVPEDLVGHIVTGYMDAPSGTGAGKTVFG